ncbi:MAG: hypothetical protein GVY11_02275 [Gammaproteobacteria bacterium]|jgi:hypothetical protein|nr:hypothetical protein [Gammaproteobacteria bacterium]
MKSILIKLAVLVCVLAPVSSLANSPCTDAVHIVDNRSEAQAESDRGNMGLYCVKFVLARWQGELAYGWVEWHKVEIRRAVSSHRLGLFPADVGWTMVFGRLPGRVQAEPGTASASVLLDRARWWLVNATRHGWQLRSGTISEPSMDTLRKLFTDVALNAGIAKLGQSLEEWWPGRL